MLAAAVAMAAGAPWPVLAQEPTPDAAEPAAVAAETAPPAAGAGAGDAVGALEKRVKFLEEQMIDLRTMLGAMQSQGGAAPSLPAPGLAAQPAAPASPDPAAGEPVDAAAVPAAPEPESAPDAGMAGMSGMAGMFGMDGMSGLFGGNADEKDAAATERKPAKAPTFGESRGGFAGGGLAGTPGRTVTREPAGTDLAGTPEDIYKQAYGYMLAGDYAAAETAFKALIEGHPKADLAGNAQYWLGETYYVRSQYRPAADAFLKAYREFPNGVKAPDSLLKLAITLAKLGETDAACRTFGQLDRTYPNAPEHIRQKANQEQRRAGCS